MPMIEEIVAYLDSIEKAKTACKSTFLTEKGKGVKLSSPSRRNSRLIHIDIPESCKAHKNDYLIKNTTCRCDCLIAHDHSKARAYIFFIELKGSDFPRAIEQLESTINHDLVKGLLAAISRPGVVCRALVIIGKHACIEWPVKEDIEERLNMRIFTETIDNDECFDIRNHFYRN